MFYLKLYRINTETFFPWKNLIAAFDIIFWKLFFLLSDMFTENTKGAISKSISKQKYFPVEKMFLRVLFLMSFFSY